MKKFGTTINGYDKTEVNRFVDDVTHEYSYDNGLQTITANGVSKTFNKFVNTDDYDVTDVGKVSHDLYDVYQTGGLNYSGDITYNDVSKNIYDLEGNVWAWTTEAYNTHGRIGRGGWFRRQ